MRDELMIFKAEHAQIFARFDMSQNLNITDTFQRRGYRRQQAFLRNENFISALRLADFEKLLSPQEMMYWINALQA